MVLAFTEEQAIEIRKTGLSIIQFKHCIKNSFIAMSDALKQCIIAIKSAFEICGKLFRRIENAIDDIRYSFETSKDRLGYPTSRRYRFVKMLGNMGYRKHDVWVVTRTYLARSNC